MLYHVSPQAGIKTLRPAVSSHGRAYVYAIENRTTALLFGARHDDFDFAIDETENSVPEVYECYPNAFQSVFQNAACTVYSVAADGFQRGVTGWAPELVCETAVPVLEETFVPDLYACLCAAAQKGELLVHHYEQNDAYRRRILLHLLDRIFRAEDPCALLARDARFQTHLAPLAAALRQMIEHPPLR